MSNVGYLKHNFCLFSVNTLRAASVTFSMNLSTSSLSACHDLVTFRTCFWHLWQHFSFSASSFNNFLITTYLTLVLANDPTTGHFCRVVSLFKTGILPPPLPPSTNALFLCLFSHITFSLFPSTLPSLISLTTQRHLTRSFRVLM